jgi:tetratricopeptide (TPR) repeat protein
VPATPALLPRAPAAREPGAWTRTSRWVRGLVPWLIALVTSAAFLPTLENQFVNLDDDHNLLNNPHYRGLGGSQLRWMWTTFHMGHYVPLAWMTFGLDYLVWGMKPLGYHLSSLLLHAANAVMVYFVVRRILRAALPGLVEHRPAGLAISAAFAALLFALHPLRVESVAWATERRDVLSGLFYLVTILLYLQAHEREERGRGRYWGIVALYACALSSKAIAVSFPVVALILDVYPLRRLGGPAGWWGQPARRVYLEKIPFVLLAGVASALAILAQARSQAMTSLELLSVADRLAVAAYGLSFYLWKMIAPVNLSPLYELRADGVNPWVLPFLLSYGVVLTLTGLAWILRRRVPGFAAAWMAYVVTLLPVLGLFQSGPQMVADRYTYLAGLGWAILAGAGLLIWWPRLPRLLSGAVVGVLPGLAALTWNQVQVWHDSERLWTHAVAIDRDSSLAQHSLGTALAEQGKRAEAIEHYRRALEIRPDFADALTNWGAVLAQQGKLAPAIEHLQHALRLRPDSAEAHTNLGGALAVQGKLAEAIEHLQHALRLEPDYAPAHSNLGFVLAQQGKRAEAIEHYRQALRIRPDYADAQSNLAEALRGLGREQEATDVAR